MTFSGVGDAIEYEFQRQAAALLLSSNSTISASSSSPLASLPLLPQETRGFDEKSRSTFKLRDKEDSMDYRFMPEPDLPPVPVTRKMIERIRKDMKEDLDVRQRRLLEAYGLSDYTTNVLMDEPGAVEYFEQVP